MNNKEQDQEEVEDRKQAEKIVAAAVGFSISNGKKIWTQMGDPYECLASGSEIMLWELAVHLTLTVETGA